MVLQYTADTTPTRGKLKTQSAEQRAMQETPHSHRHTTWVVMVTKGYCTGVVNANENGDDFHHIGPLLLVLFL